MVKRVALLFATSGHSGVDRIIHNLLPEFAKTDHQFDLLLIKRHGPHLSIVPENMRIVQLPVSHKRSILIPLIWYLHRRRPHVLLTANHQLNRAALLARRFTGVDTRICIRMGMSLTAKLNNMESSAQKRLIRSMQRWYPRADAVIAPSQGVGRDLMQLADVSENKLNIIPNPLINKNVYEQAKAELEHPWFKDCELPVILGIGSLEPRKDFPTLVRGFSLLREKISCRLVILGEGKQRQSLWDMVQSLGLTYCVDLPGYDSNPYKYLTRSNLFVLTSRMEGSSAVLAEALACGTPVVSTDCHTGPREILQDGYYGKLVPVGNYTNLAEAMWQEMFAYRSKEELYNAVTQFQVHKGANAYMSAMSI